MVVSAGAEGDGKLDVTTFQKFLNEVQRDLLHITFLQHADTVDGKPAISTVSLAEMLLHDANINPSRIPAFVKRVKSYYAKRNVRLPLALRITTDCHFLCPLASALHSRRLGCLTYRTTLARCPWPTVVQDVTFNFEEITVLDDVVNHIDQVKMALKLFSTAGSGVSKGEADAGQPHSPPNRPTAQPHLYLHAHRCALTELPVETPFANANGMPPR